MNCRDVTGILDDERVESLDPAQRQQAQAHVAVCADCARAWHVQTSLAALPDMALPADFSAHCRVLVAASPGSARKRAGNRHLQAGLLAALAAAAVVVVVLLLQPAAPSLPDVDVRGAQLEVSPLTIDGAPAEHLAELLPAVAVEASSAPLFTVRVVLAEPLEGARMDADGTLPETTQKVLRAFAEDPSMEQSLRSLRVALLEELRGIPGLALVDSDPAEVTPSSRDFRLQIGTLLEPGSDGRLRRKDSRYVTASLVAELLQPAGKSIDRLTTFSTIDLLASCSSGTPAVDPPCLDVRGAAVDMVRKLQLQVFPSESSAMRALQARFRDSTLDAAQRLKALAELLKLQAKTGDKSLLRDPGVVRAVIELAASADPAIRAQLWRSMRGVGSAALIEPLIRSLLQDASDAQLAAIETLAADFGTDPRVRSALEAVAAGDARPLVRAAAERGLSGEEGWKRYVVASLKDSSRPAAQRVEAFMYYLYPPGPEPGSDSENPGYWQIMQELLDDAAVRALAEALPDAGPLQGGNRGLLLISNFAYRNTQNPAVTDMLLRFLEHDTWARNRTVAGEVLARAHGSEPRVRAALEKALNNDPDPKVRDWIRLIMNEKTQ